MQTNITGQHLDISPALKAYVEQKVARLTKYDAHMTNIHVVLSVEKERQKAEATINASGTQVFAEDEKDDMYAAIDSIMAKLERQLKKHREKLSSHRH